MKIATAFLVPVICLISLNIAACNGGANGTSSPTTLPTVATPTFSVATGTYSSSQSITISTATAGATIYYTTDGNVPATSSSKYTSAITVSSSMTLKAIATASGYNSSAVATAAYTISTSSSGLTNGLAELPSLSTTGVPQPSGAVGGLKVLDWAGFSSAVTYTFDDSLASQLSNYSQLHATGFRMTFFQISSIGYNAGWQQVVNDGNELGNHTAHHCYADGTGCGSNVWVGSILAEYNECNQFLEQSYGVSNVWDTASPYGDTGYDATAATLFFLNRGTWGGQIAPNDSTDPYNLLVYVAAANDTASIFDAQIDSARSSDKWQIFVIHSLGGDGGFAPINPADLLASIYYAKAYSDVWVDDQVNIGSYWAGQKAVTEGTTTQSGSDITVSWTLPAHFPPGKFVRVTVTGGTVSQGGVALPWNSAGYYEVALDPGSFTIAP
jgi:hypothetical protein